MRLATACTLSGLFPEIKIYAIVRKNFTQIARRAFTERAHSTSLYVGVLFSESQLHEARLIVINISNCKHGFLRFSNQRIEDDNLPSRTDAKVHHFQENASCLAKL